MRLLVCGSRTWTDDRIMRPFLAILRRSDTLIHGACPTGADHLFARLAVSAGCEIEPFPAAWEVFGRAAGMVRNKRMLEEGKPDLVIAFSEHPLTPGTRNMVTLAREAGVPVYVVSHG